MHQRIWALGPDDCKRLCAHIGCVHLCVRALEGGQAPVCSHGWIPTQATRSVHGRSGNPHGACFSCLNALLCPCLDGPAALESQDREARNSQILPFYTSPPFALFPKCKEGCPDSPGKAGHAACQPMHRTLPARSQPSTAEEEALQGQQRSYAWDTRTMSCCRSTRGGKPRSADLATVAGLLLCGARGGGQVG